MSDEPEPGALERLARLTTAAGGGLLGYGLGGPEGALAGSASPAAIDLAWHLGQRALTTRRDRASRTLDLAAAHLHTDLDGIAQRATADPARLELVARVLEAAGRTPLPEKVHALGRVLARGLDPDGRVDFAFALAAALDDLEAPDVEVLHLLDTEPAGPIASQKANGRGWAPHELAERLPGHSQVLEVVLRTLDRHALVDDTARGQFLSVEGRSRWAISKMGQQVLELLRDQ